MKVTSSQSELPLARNRVVVTTPLGGAAAVSIEAGQAQLERLTVVSARPDGLVYVRAEYAPFDAGDDPRVVATVPKRPLAPQAAESDQPGTIAAAQSAAALAALPAIAGPAAAPRGARAGGLSVYLKPVEQYALTQRLRDARSAPGQIDVHA